MNDNSSSSHETSDLARRRKGFLASRKVAGQVIDPETCEIWDAHCQILDPYGVDTPPDEYDCIGQVIFVRSAESDGPVCAYDLPEDIARALHARIERGEPTDEWDDFPF